MAACDGRNLASVAARSGNRVGREETSVSLTPGKGSHSKGHVRRHAIRPRVGDRAVVWRITGRLKAKCDGRHLALGVTRSGNRVGREETFVALFPGEASRCNCQVRWHVILSRGGNRVVVRPNMRRWKATRNLALAAARSGNQVGIEEPFVASSPGKGSRRNCQVTRHLARPRGDDRAVVRWKAMGDISH